MKKRVFILALIPVLAFMLTGCTGPAKRGNTEAIKAEYKQVDAETARTLMDNRNGLCDPRCPDR